jgi:arylsulfatase A-like enzyme
MLEFLEGLPAGRETLLTLTSSRGFPLGEHRRVGPCDEALYGELVQIPWMMQFPSSDETIGRSQALVEPADLWATLLDAWGIEGAPASPTAASLLPIVRRQAESLHDRLCILGPNGRRAIRTPAWHLLTDSEPALFAKPDDRWEVNDVATRCQEVAECLQDALMQYDLTLPVGRVSELPPLSDALLNGLD